MTTGKTIILSTAVLIAAVGALAAGWFVAETVPSSAITGSHKSAAGTISLEERRVGNTAFFYQYVGKGENATRVGFTDDGLVIHGAEHDVLPFTLGKGIVDTPGDPTYSHLRTGAWAVTAWTTPDDSRRGAMLYYEGTCPNISADDLGAIMPSSQEGCRHVFSITSGKTSQIVSDGDDMFVTHMMDGEIYLSHVGDASHTPADLEETGLCVLEKPAASIDAFGFGDTQKILSRSDADILMSDTALTRRADGTWVLFVKGIPEDNGCLPNTTCELCQRGIYRTTSDDLLTWTPLERVVNEASVPDAYTDAEGTVWLYWQDFSDVCASQNERIAQRAPISRAHEQSGSYELSEPERILFADEAFENDDSLHYATNANPMLLTNDEADALEACF